MRPPTTIVAAALLLACGGSVASPDEGQAQPTDGGAGWQEQPANASVEESFVSGRCANGTQCARGQYCYDLSVFGPPYLEPVCLTTADPCSFVVRCEVGIKCWLIGESPQAVTCQP